MEGDISDGGMGLNSSNKKSSQNRKGINGNGSFKKRELRQKRSKILHLGLKV